MIRRRYSTRNMTISSSDKEGRHNLSSAPSLVQPTMMQLGGVEYDLKNQTKTSPKDKTIEGNQNQLFKKSQQNRRDDIEKKASSYKGVHHFKESQSELAAQQGRINPIRVQPNTRRTLVGGGYGQTPAGLQVRVPDVNLGGSFGGGHGGGYGGGGGQQYGIPPPSFQIQGPQKVNLGFGQNLNLGLGQNFNLGLGQDINIRGPQNINVPGLNIPFMDLRICPDIILSLIVLAGAAAALGLYFAIIGVGRRRRKRSTYLGAPIGTYVVSGVLIFQSDFPVRFKNIMKVGVGERLFLAQHEARRNGP